MNQLHHLYISPLEQCNLCCKMCYTTKTSHRLTNTQTLDFICRYQQEVSLQSVTFCGGEVFMLPDFPDLVNQLTAQGLFIQIITNGSIDRLDQLANPNLVNLIVSLDGLPAYHDQNRGNGMWQRSVDFLRKARQLGFHTEVFSVVTKENIAHIDEFERLVGVPVTYHPRKPLTYLDHHPVSNQVGTTDGFTIPQLSDRRKLAEKHQVFPPVELGCYQISVMSDGQVYGCCEGIHPLGTITDDPKLLITNLKSRLQDSPCRGCVEPDFMCGYKSEYSTESPLQKGDRLKAERVM